MAVYARRRRSLDRGQEGLVVLLVGMALVGWLITDHRMAGIDAGPGTDLGSFGFYIGSWVVMMAAMMFPSIVPMVLVYRLIEHRRREQQLTRRGSTTLFITGYLVSWTAFGALAYALFVGVRSLSVGAFSWHRGGPYLAGAVLLAAGIYQLTPAKNACLRRCRGPLQFLTDAWRDGPLGAPPSGDRARRLVHRLLLGADGRAVRARGHEHRLDAPDRSTDRDREARAMEDVGHAHDRNGARRPGDRGRTGAIARTRAHPANLGRGPTGDVDDERRGHNDRPQTQRHDDQPPPETFAIDLPGAVAVAPNPDARALGSFRFDSRRKQ
jgi:uncharacterized membrane protein